MKTIGPSLDSAMISGAGNGVALALLVGFSPYLHMVHAPTYTDWILLRLFVGGLVGGMAGGVVIRMFLPHFAKPLYGIAATAAGIAVMFTGIATLALTPHNITTDLVAVFAGLSVLLGIPSGLILRADWMHRGLLEQKPKPMHWIIAILARRRKPRWVGLRREKIAAKVFPEDWRQVLRSNVPQYSVMTADERTELERQIQVFISEKHFEGCGDLKMTDEIRVTIAAHACTLTLHLDAGFFPKLRTILVYPTAYKPKYAAWYHKHSTDEADPHLGESWGMGVVVLAWDAVKANARRNPDQPQLVYHELAHQLDQEDGAADGVPLLATPEQYERWTRVLKHEYKLHCEAVENGDELVMRDYGATNHAEFFAVATECFFEAPKKLHDRHPDVYDVLKEYYQQDPAK
jgi:Mlc titration factor MtfA (ptsG expression regulator)